MRFTVKRSKWVRGSKEAKYGRVGLLNENGNMCCLGFVCKKLGASNDDIYGVGFPSGVLNSQTTTKFLDMFPDDSDTHRQYEDDAAEINDDKDLAPNTREARLKKLFRSRGHELVFVP